MSDFEPDLAAYAEVADSLRRADYERMREEQEVAELMKQGHGEGMIAWKLMAFRERRRRANAEEGLDPPEF